MYIFFMDPFQVFPYKPPTEFIKEKYSYIFHEQFTIKQKFIKIIFDKFFSFMLLIISSPIIFLLKIAYVIEGLIIPEVELF